VAHHTTINVLDATRVDLALLCQWLPLPGAGLGEIEASALPSWRLAQLLLA